MDSNLVEKDDRYLLNVYNRLDLEIVKGKGSYLYDKKGDKYLDMFSGIAVNSLGVNNQKINEAIFDQMKNYIHISNYFATKPVVNLAGLLVENTFASKVFFANSGSEVNEAALKLAKLYGKKYNKDKVEILAAHNSFHGRTSGSLSLTGRKKYRDQFSPLLPRVKHFGFNNLESLQAEVSDKTCAVFLEMIQGEGGVHEVSNDFISTLTELSDKYNFLIILDEIQTGLGRTGDFFAHEKYAFQPDMVTLAKSLGGGVPLGALLVREELEDVFSPGDHGSTFGGNPVACAAGEYVVNRIMDGDFISSLNKKSKLIFEGLNQLKEEYPAIISEIRGRGMLVGIEAGEYASRIKQKGMEQNLLLNVTDQTVIRLLPALNISKGEIEDFLDIFADVLYDIQNG
jgi:acetylornithine/N-succinyldiaminopimelate aminotransferase